MVLLVSMLFSLLLSAAEIKQSEECGNLFDSVLKNNILWAGLAKDSGNVEKLQQGSKFLSTILDEFHTRHEDAILNQKYTNDIKALFSEVDEKMPIRFCSFIQTNRTAMGQLERELQNERKCMKLDFTYLNFHQNWKKIVDLHEQKLKDYYKDSSIIPLDIKPLKEFNNYFLVFGFYMVLAGVEVRIDSLITKALNSYK
jgi:hypothetical protein